MGRFEKQELETRRMKEDADLRVRIYELEDFKIRYKVSNHEFRETNQRPLFLPDEDADHDEFHEMTIKLMMMMSRGNEAYSSPSL